MQNGINMCGAKPNMLRTKTDCKCFVGISYFGISPIVGKERFVTEPLRCIDTGNTVIAVSISFPLKRGTAVIRMRGSICKRHILAKR